MPHFTIRPFEYSEPSNIHEAVSILEEYSDDAVVMAGGTDLVPLLKAREIQPKNVVDISRIADLNHITEDEGVLKIGSLTTHATLERSNLVRSKSPVLAAAVHEIGNVQIRNLGTIGGNLANASPCADTAPALLVSEARPKAIGPAGERLVPVEDFFLFVNKTVLKEDEILTEIQIPQKPVGTVGSFIKLQRRVGHDLSIAGVAVAVTMEKGLCKEARIAMGSVAPTPLRIKKLLRSLRDGSNPSRIFAPQHVTGNRPPRSWCETQSRGQ